MATLIYSVTIETEVNFVWVTHNNMLMCVYATAKVVSVVNSKTFY